MLADLLERRKIDFEECVDFHDLIMLTNKM